MAAQFRIAVVGSGVAGLAAAWALVEAGHPVVLYEKDAHIGGHAWTQTVDGHAVDVGFMVFNRVTYPNLVRWFEEQGVETELSDMSFAVSLDGGKGCEWASTSLTGLFAQKRNLLNFHFYRMLREMLLFQTDVLHYLARLESNDAAVDRNETLGSFLTARGYSAKFCECYLVPVCAAIWSCGSDGVLACSAAAILSFLRNHHMLQIFGRPPWLTVTNRSQTYVEKIVARLRAAGSEIRLSSPVAKVERTPTGVQVTDAAGQAQLFDHVVMAVHAPDALDLLGVQATPEEQHILGAHTYSSSDIFLHRDASYMPRNKAAWSAWNFLGSPGGKVSVTYWLNKLQNLGDTGAPILVTLNPATPPREIVSQWTTSHPIPSPAAAAASRNLASIQGRDRIWFCGAYQGYGFHEDGFKAGLVAAKSLLGAAYVPLPYPRQMAPSWAEAVAKAAVLAFLQQFVQLGALRLYEDGGYVYNFGQPAADISAKQACDGQHFQVGVRIHRPAFYWKVATRADLGIADAYVDGDFTCLPDVMDFLMLLVVNRDRTRRPGQVRTKKRGWWSPALLTAAVGSTFSYLRHLTKANTLSNARRNIADHYDLSNALFSLFLDETMTYSCAIFDSPEEPLKDAQLRKLHAMIDKARISSSHHVLEIGFGWGSMAIEVVRRTGCHVTGITLSQQQLELASERVKKAGLQHKISFMLCDYRALPGIGTFDRILSCEMLEAVGHEFYPDFFHHCDRLLAPDGIMVVQVITTPEERYDEYRQSSDFIKEYIFPGACCPAFSALTHAMSTHSNLGVEAVENIGAHYVPTLLRWRQTFMEKQSEVAAMGFGAKFVRTWDYYFAYCAAGFQTRTIGDLQIVFSRPGNTSGLGVVTPF